LAFSRRLDQRVGASLSHDVRNSFRLDHAGVEIGVPISTGVEGISAAVRVYQIDTAGDGADTVDNSG
jgi:hypothetical protein